MAGNRSWWLWLALVLIGCQPPRAEVEEKVRDGLQKRFGSAVKDLTLKEIAKGRYVGSAEDDQGTKVSIFAKVEDGKIQWRAMPANEEMKKSFTMEIANKYPKEKVKALELDLDRDGNFAGEATLAGGKIVKLHARWSGTMARLEVE